jgi:DNA-binding response OmpR family regulator
MGGQQRTILLVDDDRQFVAANRLLLEAAGYRVSEAYDAESGLARARSEKPDLVILDVIMGTPEEGFELCRRLRAEACLKQTRLLMLTAVGREFQMAFEPDGMWLPADRLLEKPIAPETLLAEVGMMFGSEEG